MTGENGRLHNTMLESNNKIVLLDFLSENLNLSEIENSKETISFNIDIHKQLSTKKFDHKISDDFLTEDDLHFIQKQAYHFSDWYVLKEIKDKIEYDGINLGRLFYDEISNFFVQFLKKFYEIKKIHKLYPNATFLASEDLFDIVYTFTNSVIKIPNSKNKLYSLPHDVIRVNFKIKNQHFKFFISKSLYQKIKQMSEFLIHLFFYPNENNFSQKKRILVIEFHTTRYRNFFLASKNSLIDLIYFGRRRPAIWNLESFNTMKKSGCRIITFKALFDIKTKNYIKQESKKIVSNIDSLLNDDSILTSFFSIDGTSFWKIVKPTFVKLLRNRIEKTITEIQLVKRMFEKYSIDKVLVLSEIGFTEQIVIRYAKKSRIPVIHIQVGLYPDTPEAIDNNISQSVYPTDADEFIVWGKLTEQDAITNGKVPQNKIKVLGSPRYDKVPFDQNTNYDDFVLLATSGPQPEDVHGLSVRTIEKYEENIKKVCETVLRQKKKLIIKLHPSPTELDVTELVHKIDPKIVVYKYGDIIDLVKLCNVMIVVDLSTSILEAQIFHKPVIFVQSIDYKWGIPEPFRSNYCVVSSIEDLENLLQKILNDTTFRHQVVQRGDQFIKNYFVNLGHASEKILKHLET